MKGLKTLSIGTHIIALPIDREYSLDELFPYELTNSFIEKLDANGKFVSKEKVSFLNNEFIVSGTYKKLQPFETIRLTLKRAITIDWDVHFTSNTKLLKENSTVEEHYTKDQALQLMQLCSLVYGSENEVESTIGTHYSFDYYYYFSKQNYKNTLQKNYLKILSTLFSSKLAIVDLQFLFLSKFDANLQKEVITIVFQGSQELEDWITNISMRSTSFFGKEKVHHGFYESLKLFFKTIDTLQLSTASDQSYALSKDIDFLNENCEIILSGHSLGGAIASLVGCYFLELGVKEENIQVYTFGAPPIGTKTFCDLYKTRLKEYRVVNEFDIVPKIENVTSLRHLSEKIELKSNEKEIHSCDDYIDNLIDIQSL